MIRWTGVNEFVGRLTEMGDRATAEARAAVVEVAGEIEKAAKQNASGRPGPEVVTGTLRRGIQTAPVTPWGIGGWQTRVRPTAIYSRRIELGFHGADSLGRHFDQPPYPYFRPAMERVGPRAVGIYQAHMQAALGG